MFLCSCRRLSISLSNCSLALSEWSSACFVFDSIFTISAFCTTTQTKSLLWYSKKLLGEKAKLFILPSSLDQHDLWPAPRVFLLTEKNGSLQPELYLHRENKVWCRGLCILSLTDFFCLCFFCHACMFQIIEQTLSKIPWHNALFMSDQMFFVKRTLIGLFDFCSNLVMALELSRRVNLAFFLFFTDI